MTTRELPRVSVDTQLTRVSLSDLLTEVDRRAGSDLAHLPVLSLTKDRGLIPQTSRFKHRVATEDVSDYKVVEQGQVVYNPFVLWEGAIHTLHTPSAGLVSPVYPVWQPHRVDPIYLDFVLRSSSFLALYERLGAGTVRRRRSVSRSRFLGITLSVPDLIEQRRVARVLSTIQGAKTATLAWVSAIRAAKGAASHELFVVRGHAWPKHPLGTVAEILSGGTPPKADASAWRGQIPWVSPKDMKSERLFDVVDHISDRAAHEHSQLAPAGTVLVCVRGMILARDIPICLVENEMAFNQDVKAVVPQSDVGGEFLLYALTAAKEQLMRHIGTSAHGTRRIGGEAIASWEIAVPSKAEQAAAVRALRALDDAEVKGRTSIQAHELLLQSALRHLLGAPE